MNKLDFQTPDIVLNIKNNSESDLSSARRLVVLIPAEVESSSVTRRLWELANATGSAVQLLALCKDPDQESAHRRDLVTMAALIRDARIPVETKVEMGTNWVDAAKRNVRDGDMIVCIAEPVPGTQRKSLSQILESNLNCPVYILSNVSSRTPPQTRWTSQAFAWAGSLLILIAAFLLQIQVVSRLAGWPQTTILILSVITETWLIGAWNSLLG